MHINESIKQFALGAVFMAASAAASAQAYGVISVGTSRLDVDCAGTTACDKSDTAVKLLGGFKFTPNLAGEFGYFDFGKATATVGGLDVGVKTTAFGGGVAFHTDLSPDWNFVARAGVAQVKTKISGGGVSDSDNNTKLYGGLGVGYKINKTTSIDGSWDTTTSRYNKNGNDTGNANVNSFNIGLTFGF